MKFVFDLDGTLVSTREANRLAYESIGVLPPANFHHVPWNSWTTEEIHKAKNRALPEFIHAFAKPLPLLECALQLEYRNTCVLSNCSDSALLTLRKKFPELRELGIRNRMSGAEKAIFISANYMFMQGVFFDDCLLTCQRVAQMTTFQTVHVQEAL